MNKFSFTKTVLFVALTIAFLFTACKKDVGEKFSGVYTGVAETYSMGSGGSQTFPGSNITVTKLSKTTLRLDLVNNTAAYNFSTEETLRKNGAFGDGFYSPRGTFFTFGKEGKFTGDSLYYSLAKSDSSGATVFFSFRGHRN